MTGPPSSGSAEAARPGGMRRSGEVVSWRAPKPWPERQRQYERLARAIALSSEPTGLVLEQRTDEPEPRLVVRASGDLAEIDRDPEVLRTTRAERRAPAFEPPAGWAHRFGTLLVGRPIASSATAGPAAEPPGIPRLSEGGRWIGVQTFWLSGTPGRVWVARRFCLAAPASTGVEETFDRTAALLAQHWRTIVSRAVLPRRSGRCGGLRDWRRRDVRTTSRRAWAELGIDGARASAELPRARSTASTLAWERGHLCVFGATGVGKTTFLAELGASAIVRGRSVVAIDLHGDLGPAIVARTPVSARSRLVAIDVERSPVPGVNVLGGADEAARERAAAHFVAAIKRLSSEGYVPQWGPKLERNLDLAVRLAQEHGGTIVDVADLLANPARREAARLATSRPEFAAFLDEIAPIVRRQPDFLWSASARLSKVLLLPSLTELLAPPGPDVPVDELLSTGGSVLIRLPISTLGPEGAHFAASILLARLYLGRAACADPSRAPSPILLLLDEGQSYSAPLVAEILAEGRKYGVRAALATQFPGRLAREVEAAARGAVTTHLCFRVPLSDAGPTARWLGRPELSEPLAVLPTGEALLVDAALGSWGSPLGVERPPSGTIAAWVEGVDRTRALYGGERPRAPRPYLADPAIEALLLAALSAQERHAAASAEELIVAGSELPGARISPELLRQRWPDVVARGYVERTPSGVRLSAAGASALGLSAPTGAPRERWEHRALLMAAFRLLARRGYRLEIVRQGRFDTTLPDARLKLLPGRQGPLAPRQLAEQVERAKGGWAWRFFHGRDVHFEAEVSGALRPERIRHGAEKAAKAGAYVVFLVTDARRANRVRRTVRAAGFSLESAQVWTLGLAPDGAAIARKR